MKIETEQSYLIRDYNELLMFIKELKLSGEFSYNRYQCTVWGRRTIKYNKDKL